jgi:vitellogenic carboxypeptidase-like protein
MYPVLAVLAALAGQARGIATLCSEVNLSASLFKYPGLVRTGYLATGRGKSALAFTFYGKRNATLEAIKTAPTLLWMDGGPGLSSQTGNLLEVGPVLLSQEGGQFKAADNRYAWNEDYNLLFMDQPVGAGLSFADESQKMAFPTNLRNSTEDLYRALLQLYNSSEGCFKKLGIKDSAPLVVFGNGYASKFAAAIGAHIKYEQGFNGFLKGLRGVALGDGFLHPEYMIRELPSYAYNLGILEFNERRRIERKVMNATFMIRQRHWAEAQALYE